MCRGVISKCFDIDEIIDRADRKLFARITQPTHCLHHLLPLQTTAHCPYSLRQRQQSQHQVVKAGFVQTVKYCFPGLSRTCKDQIPGLSRTHKTRFQ